MSGRKERDIAGRRLTSQRIADPQWNDPARVVAALCAMQAQDRPGALWAIGLRTKNRTENDVEKAIAARSIVRTWMMRGTLHFVAARDVHWMLDLLAPRLIEGDAGRRRQLEIDDADMGRCRKLFGKALQGGKALSRKAIYGSMEAAHQSTAGQRGYHILFQFALEGLICFGPEEGTQQTFTLLDEWVPRARGKPVRDEALARLVTRYFQGHGPATLRDFLWWSGLPVADARSGLEQATDILGKETVHGESYWLPRSPATPGHTVDGLHLLPPFDEYLLGYRDRTAVLSEKHNQRVAPGANGLFRPIVVEDGRVTGTWKRSLRGGRVGIDVDLFDGKKRPDRAAIEEAMECYGRFLGKPVVAGL